MSGRERTRIAPYLALIVGIGLADSITASYLILFATVDLGLSPLEVGVATSLATVSGIAITTWAGRTVDRLPRRSPLVIALLTAAVGFGLLVLVRGFVPVLLACVLIGSVNAGFPQVFALERLRRDAPAGGSATARLRAGWSVAWSLGPLFAGLVVVVADRRVLFATGAVLLLAAAVLAATLRVDGRPAGERAATVARAGGRPAAPTVLAAVTVFHFAMFAGSFALPLLVTRDLRADPGWIGVIFGVCAAVEVGAAFLVGRLLRTRRASLIVLLGAAVFAVYFAGVAGAVGVAVVVALQVLRGLAIAAVGIGGIEQLRELLAPNVAAATAAFSNAVAVGSLLAGVGAGVLVQFTGARTTTAVCAGLAVVSMLLVLVARRGEQRSTDAPIASAAAG